MQIWTIFITRIYWSLISLMILYLNIDWELRMNEMEDWLSLRSIFRRGLGFSCIYLINCLLVTSIYSIKTEKVNLIYPHLTLKKLNKNNLHHMLAQQGEVVKRVICNVPLCMPTSHDMHAFVMLLNRLANVQNSNHHIFHHFCRTNNLRIHSYIYTTAATN